MTQPRPSSVKVFGRYFSPTRYSRELCGTPGNCAVLQGTVRKSRELCGNPGNCADENQDTLSVESVFWMAFGGGYDQSNTEEGAHHRQAE